ncbi:MULTISPECIES: SDR family NAD(P)-dependent oxidoreductase [unclassified Ruegeria]|uniref:SDR family NAD(P)-dependent oxidoreductase n=1 Tax=unclassified Ruegeria TaxID=2625375 RepID=UPI001ADC660A|nr:MULTISPECIES: SDR family NAD(P)-dependent oxidoreductase [unclassified Ruegeria]MBO9413565.1 SDR family NAD(P)-dependent oxidoreductase [Ruegeria sp. R8_1]MBO9417252.1 SDR family NAD(P)-dependent oxidoreductase [Ruegeria sp. R8_2]
MPSAENQKPVALAIGAGDGIGAAFARRFARAGYRVAIARRDAEKSAALVAELAAEGHELHAFSLDARDEDQVVGFFDKVEAEMGPIEVALYNAGSNSPFPFLETKSTMFRKIWELACFGGFLTMREAASRMVPRGKGTILVTGASASMRGKAGFGAFASAKHGLRALAQSLAREIGPKGVHVAHIVIDAGVDMPAIHERRRKKFGDDHVDADNILVKPDSIAETFFAVHSQTPDAWTHELDLRPYGENW